MEYQRIRKCLSVFLACIFMLSNMSMVAFADEYYNVIEGSIDDSMILETNVESVFGTHKFSDATAQPIEYRYSYHTNEKTNTTEAILEFTFENENNRYQFNTKGLLPIYEDISGRLYVEGPLNGRISIDGQEYIVNIGFQKFLDSSEIYASVVLQDARTYDIASVFSFGTPVLTKDNIDTAAIPVDMDSTLLDETADLQSAARASTTFSLKGTTYANYSGTAVSGYGQRQRVYYSSYLDRVAVGVTSYTSNVNAYYSRNAGNLDTVSTGVQNFSIDLRRNNSSTPSSITGYERNYSYTSNDGTVATAVMQVFKDAFTMLGFPSTLLNAFFSAPQASISENIGNSNEYKITANAGMGAFRMDDTSYCAPIVFQISHTQSVTGAYTATTTMTYKTLFMASSGVITTYYTTAATATQTFYI